MGEWEVLAGEGGGVAWETARVAAKRGAVRTKRRAALLRDMLGSLLRDMLGSSGVMVDRLEAQANLAASDALQR